MKNDRGGRRRYKIERRRPSSELVAVSPSASSNDVDSAPQSAQMMSLEGAGAGARRRSGWPTPAPLCGKQLYNHRRRSANLTIIHAMWERIRNRPEVDINPDSIYYCYLCLCVHVCVYAGGTRKWHRHRESRIVHTITGPFFSRLNPEMLLFPTESCTEPSVLDTKLTSSVMTSSGLYYIFNGKKGVRFNENHETNRPIQERTNERTNERINKQTHTHTNKQMFVNKTVF